MICKKHLYVSFLSVLCCLCINTSVLAEQYGNDTTSYIKNNSSALLVKADECFDKAIKETDTDKRYYYLKDAAAAYNQYNSEIKGDIHAITQLARVYDLQKRDKYARAEFETALGINPNDKSANYYFGDYYFFRKDYGKALKYYRKAFINGMEENYSNMKKMAVIYEKLGDLKKANLFYKKAYLKNMTDNNIADKIREIESIKYNNSDYYRRNIK